MRAARPATHARPFAAWGIAPDRARAAPGAIDGALTGGEDARRAMRRMSMSDVAAPGWIVDRLRENLRSLGIPFVEKDLDRILEARMLANPLAFEELDERLELSPHEVPDYLASLRAASVVAAASPETHATHPPAPEGSSEPGDSLAATAARIRAREVSPVALVEEALARIAARDAELNAFQLVLAEQALAEARSAEREIAAGGWRGPMHGVPIAIKDLFDVAGTPTTAGSRLLEGRPRDRDCAVVERLRRAGAIIVGKTRLAEFAYSPGSNNAHYGPTRNPHDTTRDAGGSSSGSGAAVAAGMVFAALGSDTGGSIRIPAALCGIVGLKPTFGRVSLAGAVPLAWSLDHVGPMTRTVCDAGLLLEEIAGHDPDDPRTGAVPVLNFSNALSLGVRGLRIGVLGDDGEHEALGTREAEQAWRAGLDALADAGATLVPVDLPVLASLRIVNGAVCAMEAAAFHRPMLRARSKDYGEFARLRLLSAHAYAPGAFIRAQQVRAAGRREFEERCRGLDLLSTPTMPGPAPRLGVPASTRFTAPFNLLGWPAISVPVGRTAERLPLSLQLVGRPWEEATVLRAAVVVEAHAGGG
jgi:Asp-tRNA(Asn)/Glu-tRNA(Gln) amidotransferase A subunit family amidase